MSLTKYILKKWKLSLLVLFTIVLGAFATIYFNYSLLITMGVLTIIIIYGPKYFKNKFQKQMEKVSIANEELTNSLTDVFQGYDDLLMMNLESYMLNRVVKTSKNLAIKKFEYADIFGKLMGMTNGISLSSQIILFSQTAFLYFKNILPIGAISGVQYFSAVIFQVLQVFQPIL